MNHGQWSFANISFKYRLPLLIGTLLALILVACTWASYRTVKASAFDVGRERLQNLTQQLSSMLQQSANTISTKTVTAANEPAIRSFVKSPNAQSRTEVEKVLQQFLAPQDQNSLRVELWTTKRLLLVLPAVDTTPLS